MTDDLWNNLSDEARATIAKDAALAVELGLADRFKPAPALPPEFYAELQALKPQLPITEVPHGRRVSRRLMEAEPTVLDDGASETPFRAPLRPYLPSQDAPGFLRRREPVPSSIAPERMQGPWREMTAEETERFGLTTMTYDQLARFRSALPGDTDAAFTRRLSPAPSLIVWNPAHDIGPLIPPHRREPTDE